MQSIFPLLFTFLSLGSFGLVSSGSSLSELAGSANVASVAYAGSPVSAPALQAAYTGSTDKKVRVLVVPGHEPQYGGAEVGLVKERELVAELGGYLQEYLLADPKYTVFITRDSEGWNPQFANYFTANNDSIALWRAMSTMSTDAPVLTNSSTPPVYHVSVKNDVANRLYGITKWANENSIDIMLHLHLNDYPHRRRGQDAYTGLVIYTPAQSFENSITSNSIASMLLKRFSQYNATSSSPVESAGIVEDPELIAVGAHNTAGSASMLIEYGYLYQPQFTNSKVRSLALKDLAYQTYLGLQDFLVSRHPADPGVMYNPSSLYEWKTPVVSATSDTKDIYALQTALILDGDFPPEGKTMTECPHTGALGLCTKAALAEFQTKNDIANEPVGGKKTFELLQAIYNKEY